MKTAQAEAGNIAGKRATGRGRHLAHDLLDFQRDLAASENLAALEQTFLQRIQQFIALPVAGFYILNSSTGTVENMVSSGVSPYVLARYEEHGRAADPILRHILETGEAADNWSLLSQEEWLAHPLYTGVCRLQGIATMLEVPAPCGDGVLATLYFASPDDRPHPNQETLELADAVGQAFGAAFEQMNKRQELLDERGALLKALDLSRDAVVVTDAERGRRHVNPPARSLLSQLESADPPLTLDDLLVRGSGDGYQVSSIEVRLRDGTDMRVWSWSVPVEEAGSALVTILRSEGLQPPLPAIVEEFLAPREQEVARLVVDGLTNAEIATRLCLSKHTVGQYVKSTYRKLGINSRVALVRLVHDD